MRARQGLAALALRDGAVATGVFASLLLAASAHWGVVDADGWAWRSIAMFATIYAVVAALDIASRRRS